MSGDLWAGAEAQIAALLSALVKYSKYEIHAIIYNSGKLANRLRTSGIQIYIIEESRNNFFSLTYKTYKILKKEGFAILHTHRYKEN
ncbi:MAG: glycosyltransferase, partial [Candidatus Hodarchaeota archaeon]